MRDPGAVVPRLHFAQFVFAHFRQRFFIRDRIVLDGNLRRHSSHGMSATAMARVDQQLHVRGKKMLRHGDFRAIRQNEVGAIAEFLDETENVIPAPAVEPGGMLAQFVQDFVHLKRRENRFDQHRGADRPARNSDIVLREIKDVVPQARFLMALQLRQIKIGARSVREQVLGVVKEKQAEIE